MKIIQVGAGGFGESWLEIVMRAPEWEVAGVVDIDQNVLKKVKEKWNFSDEKLFTSLDECLKKVKADALLNVTPPEFHKEITVKAIKSGLHVLVEKPMADTLKNAEEMVEVAEKYRKKLMVSQNYRYRKGARSLRKFIEEGLLGNLSYCNLNFQKGPKFKGFRIKMEYPLLIDMSIHHFDLLRYILGKEPVSVYAESFNPCWSWFSGDACLNIIFEFQDNIRVNYSGSWVSKGKETPWDGEWEIYGENGTVIWNEKIKFISEGKEEEMEMINMEREERDYSLLEFYKSIKEDREPETSGRDNIKSLKMVFNSLNSIKRGRRVSFI